MLNKPNMLLNKLLIICYIHFTFGATFSQLKTNHKLINLNQDEVRTLAEKTDINHVDTILDNILIPRVVGTKNHDKVYNYIINELETYEFTVETDEFHDQTPNMGVLKFRNIIGTLNPNADRYLVLACHYDSKYFKNEVFVGAIDSAVPCAMMLNLAKVLQNEMKDLKTSDVSLMLLFLDGEEAFKEWSNYDSLYGARHLAAKWENVLSKTQYGNVKHLEKIDAFVLLDLIGAKNPTFFSYFPNTEKLFYQLSDAEDKLSKQGLLSNHNQKYFKRASTFSFVEDDHVPFMIRDVPILHIIPKQFPKVWHTPQDNRDAIDMDTIENLNKIFRVFLAEYFHLPISNDEDDDIDSLRSEYIQDEL